MVLSPPLRRVELQRMVLPAAVNIRAEIVAITGLSFRRAILVATSNTMLVTIPFDVSIDDWIPAGRTHLPRVLIPVILCRVGALAQVMRVSVVGCVDFTRWPLKAQLAIRMQILLFPLFFVFIGVQVTVLILLPANEIPLLLALPVVLCASILLLLAGALVRGRIVISPLVGRGVPPMPLTTV